MCTKVIWCETDNVDIDVAKATTTKPRQTGGEVVKQEDSVCVCVVLSTVVVAGET